MARVDFFIQRAKNIQKIIDTECHGSIEIFSKKMDVKIDTITKYLNPNSSRPCNDKAARKIEICFGWSDHSLDSWESDRRDVYYIAVYTNTRHTRHIIEFLQQSKSVVECSCLMGDFDILIKAEVESFEQLEMLQAKIIKFPGIKRTSTFSVIKSLHWQRAQPERMSIPKENKKLLCSNGLEEFIYDKIHYYLNRIKALEEGEATAEDKHNIILKSYQIIRGARQSIATTINPREKIKWLDQYIETEISLIRRGVESRKIIFLCEEYKKNWANVKVLYNQFANIGSKIRFGFIDDFIHSGLSPHYEQFTIIDNLYACIRRDEREMYLIKRSPEFVEQYVSTFEANWDNSRSFNDIEALIHQQRTL